MLCWRDIEKLIDIFPGLLFSRDDFSVCKVSNPVDIDGKSMRHVIEVGDILCFVNNQHVKKVCCKSLLLYILPLALELNLGAAI